MKHKNKLLMALAIASIAAPAKSLACACGCGVFDVGTSSILPTKPGGTMFIEYDFVNQNKNWHGTSSAPSADNDDKKIRTDFVTVGGQYMFDRDWGVRVEVPYWNRNVVSDDGTGLVSAEDKGVGDIRIRGIYTGISPDMSTGFTYGLKLPTGDYKDPDFERDTQIGTGSTDLLLGAYHMGNLAEDWSWFSNIAFDQPIATKDNYRPGTEVNLGAGVYYEAWDVGGIKITPVTQLIGTYRAHDSGAAASVDDTGYKRVLFSPGVEVETGGFRVYGDVGLPVYQDVRGNQVTAPVLFKINLSRDF